MFARQLFTLLFTSSSLAFVVPRATNSSSNCTSVEIRKEWSNLTSTEKSAYLNAELCLFHKAGQTGLDGADSRYEDLSAVHQQESDYVHGVGQFLPWHRYFLHTHQYLLRNECNYTGPFPWWDEERDAGNFLDSAILDPDTGFGGNGTGSDGCVEDGPFANTTLHVGPGTATTDHCLSRFVTESYSDWTNSTYVDECNAEDDYLDFWECINPRPHAGGHVGVGGTNGVLGDVASSPGDPIFFMHHGYIDRLWYKWQNEDPDTRTYELGGYTTTTEPLTGWVNTTLDYELHVFQIIPNVTVGTVMSTKGGYLCYEYDY